MKPAQAVSFRLWRTTVTNILVVAATALTGIFAALLWRLVFV